MGDKNMQQARQNMVEQQIKPWNVNDSRILNAFRTVRREDFVPAAYRDIAFADVQIPLDGGVMLEPKIIARMLQSLSVQVTDRVLLVGVSTGYIAALLGHIAHSVVGVEPDQGKIELAQQNMTTTGLNNVEFVRGDARDGWPAMGEVDAVFVRNALNSRPDGLCAQLATQGRCVAVVGSGPIMELMCYRATDEGIVNESILDTITPKLDGSDDVKPAFIF